MNRMFARWEEFAKIIPREASPTQRNEMKRSFYAGALYAFDVITAEIPAEFSVGPQATDGDVKMLQELRREILSNLASHLEAQGST